MTTSVLTAVDHRYEAQLVTTLETRREVEVTRRCADVAELLSVAAVGLAEVALVSGSFPGVDREVVRTLAGQGVAVVGVVARGDEAGERTLRQLGVRAIIHPDIEAAELAGVVTGLDGSGGAGPGSDGSGSDGSGGDGLGGAGLGGDSSAANGSGGDCLGGDGWPRPASPNPLERSGHREGSSGGVDLLESVPGRAEPSPSGDVPHVGRGLGSELGPELGPELGSGLGSEERSDEGRAGGSVSVPVKPGTVVAVWGPIGSPGRTTLAATLAAVWAAAGVAVLLVDADTHGASVGQVLGLIDEAPGVAAAARLSDQGTLDLAALSRVAPEVTPGFRVLTGLPRPDRWPELRQGAVADVLRVARLLSRVVIVDCGHALEDDEELSYDTAAPRRNAATLTALAQADIVVAVAGGDPVGLQRLVRGMRDLKDRGLPRPVVVVNKVRAASAGPHPERSITEVLQRFSGLDDLVFLPWAPVECDAALWAGQTLVESAPQAPLTQAIAALAVRLLPEAMGPSRAGTGRAGRGSSLLAASGAGTAGAQASGPEAEDESAGVPGRAALALTRRDRARARR